MNKKLFVIFVLAVMILPFAVIGCKARVEKTPEEMQLQSAEAPAVQDAGQVVEVTEPAKTIATDTIPPTAAPQAAEKPAQAQEKTDKTRDIQKALKNALFYTGEIDGKLGPKTKRAIEEFQKAKGLKVDGKVGSKTWAELEKYLTQ